MRFAFLVKLINRQHRFVTCIVGLSHERADIFISTLCSKTLRALSFLFNQSSPKYRYCTSHGPVQLWVLITGLLYYPPLMHCRGYADKWLNSACIEYAIVLMWQGDTVARIACFVLFTCMPQFACSTIGLYYLSCNIVKGRQLQLDCQTSRKAKTVRGSRRGMLRYLYSNDVSD